MGCILGPVGEELELPGCAQHDDSDRHPLGERLHDGLSEVETGLQQIRDVFGLPSAEVDTCIEATALEMHVEPIKNKLRLALLSDPKSALRNLTVVFGGTSVTAGHDNWYNQSYPFAFERAASCAFKAAGINLIVRNAALGANQAFQYGLCTQWMFGPDADLVFYEINAMAGADGSTDYEIALRNFCNEELFPRRPSFIYTGLTGVSDRKIWGDVTPECKAPCKPGEEMFLSNMCPAPGCKNIQCSGDCKTPPRPTGIIGPLMQKYADFGTGVISPMHCIGQHGDKWEFGGTYTLRIGKQLNQAKGWHYGPYGHRIKGHMIAFWYLKLLKEVLEEINTAKPKDIKGDNAHHWARGYSTAIARPPTELPAPWTCTGKEDLCLDSPQCLVTLDPHRPMSFTDHLGQPIVPVVTSEPDSADPSKGVVVRPQSSDLLGWAALLEPDSAPVVDMRDYCSDFSRCPKGLKERADSFTYFHIAEIMAVAHSGKWVVAIVEDGASRHEVEMGWSNNWGWRDRKYVLMGSKKSGALKLKLHAKKEANGFILCSPPFCRAGQHCLPHRIQIHEGIALEVDGKDVTNKIHQKGKPVAKGQDMKKLEDMCIWVDEHISVGPHVLTIRGTSDEKVVNIAHVIWW